MPLRCRLTADNIGILGKRVTHVDDVADHLRPTLLRNRVHVVHMFGIKGGLQAGKFSGSTGKQLLFHCEPQDCDHRRVEERTRVSLVNRRQQTEVIK